MTEDIYGFLREAAYRARDGETRVTDELLDEVLRIGIRNQSVDDRKTARKEIRQQIQHQVRAARDL